MKRLSTVCPDCRAELSIADSNRSLHCQNCHSTFPFLSKELPVLVPNPARYLASQALGMSEALVGTRKEIARLERLANKYPKRSNELLAWSSALHANLKLFGELRDEILPYCTSADICDAAKNDSAQSNGGELEDIGQALALVRRDWSGEQACEDEINTLINTVAGAINATCGNPAPLLVLGSGKGRMAEELSRRYEYTCAIERLLAMELVRRRLHNGAVSFNIVDPRNRRFGSDIVRRVEIPHQPGPDGSRCEFAVGDARRAPWPDSSFSCVVSAYFTDVIPYSILLPEVTRLLQPGGAFIHVGPLAYHHQETGEHLAADQFVTRLADFGLSVVHTDWVKTTLRGDPTSMYTHTCDNLVMTARKAENLKVAPAELEMDAVLSFQEGVTLSTEVRISNESAAVLRSELRVGAERTVALSPLATRLIQCVDGKTRLGDIVTRLLSMLGTERLPNGELEKLKDKVAQLVEMGALRFLTRDRRIAGCADVERKWRPAGKESLHEDVLQGD